MGAILNRNGVKGRVPRRRRPEASESSGERAEGAEPAELSGHWPTLHQVAKAFRSQLHAPIPQLLDFPWYGDWNGALETAIDKGGELSVRLTIENDVLFWALKENLPGDLAWTLLEEWKKCVNDCCRSLSGIYGALKAHPDLNEYKWISDEAAKRGESGLTDWFAKMVVLEAVETACGLPQAHWQWEALVPTPEAWMVGAEAG